MAGDLFSKPPKYTIDSCSLIDIFSDEKMVSKNITPGLWTNIQTLINLGIIISHIEVLHEIKKEGKKEVTQIEFLNGGNPLRMKRIK